MVLILFLFALPLLAQMPVRVTQGEVIKLALPTPGPLKAKLADTPEVPLFSQPTGGVAGLIPVAVTLKPGSYDFLILDAHGQTVNSSKVQVLDGKYPIQNIQASKGMKELTPLPGEMEAMRTLATTVTAEKQWQEPFLLPVTECRNSPFGVLRYHNGKPSGNYHRGLDLRAPLGRPIHAPAAGTIKVAQMFRLHGGTVGIDHGQGVTSHYLHMSKIVAVEGNRVQVGDLLGYSGATGFATGPHLHWGLYVFGVPTNPERWVKKVQHCAPRASAKSTKKK